MYLLVCSFFFFRFFWILMCVYCTLCSRKTSSCLNCRHSKLERQMKHFVCAIYIFLQWKKQSKSLWKIRIHSLFMWPKMSISIYCVECVRFFLNFGGLDLDSNFIRLIWNCAALTLSLSQKHCRSEQMNDDTMSRPAVCCASP